MKFIGKIQLILAALLLFVTPTVFANVSMYGSTLHPAPADIVKSLLHPPTDISVINATPNYFYVIVPNSPVNDYLRPGFNDHIYNYDPNIYYTYIILQDIYHNTFYSNSIVCPLAIISVTGNVGNYRINYDDDLCR